MSHAGAWRAFTLQSCFLGTVHKAVAELAAALPLPAAAFRKAPEPLSLLDIGSGGGSLSRKFSEEQVKVTSLDCSYPMLCRLKRAKPGAKGVQADAAALPFPDKIFDVAVLSFVLHTLSSVGQERAVGEARRVSRAVILADYCLVERNLHYPAGAVASFIELWAGCRHFRAYRNFVRHGGLRGLCSRFVLKPAAEAPVLGHIGAALVVSGEWW